MSFEIQEESLRTQLEAPAFMREELWCNWLISTDSAKALIPTLWEFANEGISKWHLDLDSYRMYFTVYYDFNRNYFAAVMFTLKPSPLRSISENCKLCYYIEIPITIQGKITGDPIFRRL